MKILPAVIFLSLALPAFGQSQPSGTAVAPGCGPANIEFDVKTDNKQHPTAQPEGGKAIVYFLQDDADFNSRPRPTTRFGLDGAWVGATHSDSYLYVLVDPGMHHLCASWQGLVVLGPRRGDAALQINVEAGYAYYYRAKNIEDPRTRPAEVIFKELDPDEAQLLMSKFSFSTSSPKK
jgi:hypothetical protein